MADNIHPAAIEHLPVFITAPGQTDWLFNAIVVFLLAMILIVGNFYFRLHALPEHMAHKGKKVQMEIVAVLALISLFTHNHIFWIIGLLLAMIDLPDFSGPMVSIAQSLEKLSGRERTGEDEVIVSLPESEPKSEPEPKAATARGVSEHV
ncbi:MAG: hypothetical protein AAAB35_09535 [Phyllobacterium sp.]|uniref:hypothetical protein n=1 Tax=Phyllobacterium sp. TaxID=1871046 RepID=UPI0030F2143B